MAAPKIIPYDVALRSVNPVRSFDRPKAYTNDLNSVRFQFKVLDMTSEELATATAVTLVYMRDGSFFANPSTDVSRVGNVFSYSLKENEGNHAGVAQIQLVVTVDGMELASQLFDFEIINGLETKVAQEVMIYDWTTLTRDARTYIDQFVADEVFRDAQFDNAQFDRNVAFVGSQDSRDLAFGVEQTDRGAAFTAEQTNRNTAFNNAQDARALAFSESESGRTTAESGRVTAEEGRVTAESGRVTEEGKRITAESNRATAESDRVTAETGRVSAESGRVTAETNRAAAFTAFNTRLTAEETATAANKISAVKGKTFADVDARLEDIEFDTAMMGSNLVPNGNFVNAAGWIPLNSTTAASANELTVTPTSLSVEVGVYRSFSSVPGNLTYISAEVYPKYANAMQVGFYNGNKLPTVPLVPNAWNRLSGRLLPNGQALVLYHNMASSYVLTDTFKLRNIMAIDLTTTFGAGNEPTAEQMDGILAKFTNSWFDGTKNLFRANAALNKLMVVDARTEFEARNLVVNGNFPSDVGGDGISDSWAASGTLTGVSLLNNVQIFTPNSQYAGIRSSAISLQQNSKYYLIGWVKGPLTTVLQISDYGVYTIASVSEPSTFNKLSCIYSKTTASSPAASVAIQYNSTTGFGETQVKYVTLIDLTATFGAGKEPSLAEMDRLMARFPNSWFDGVKPVQTIETLYQEKANKVQEAWITPTLANGATGDVQYRKNEFGKVEFRGQVTLTNGGASIFGMPVGYRSSKAPNFVCPVPNVGTGELYKKILLNGGVNFYGSYPLAALVIDMSQVSYYADL
jgi:hypothetical protein